jgi:nicotinate-nucleotide adenylyltransferase
VSRARVGVLGGTFDPPHNGHVALARAAVARFGLDRLLVRVVVAPGHKPVATPAGDRLALARLAFAGLPSAEVALDRHPRTVDSLLELGLDDPVLLVGADELAAFSTWKDPERVLELALLGVATRPGTPEAALTAAIARLHRPDRVELFPLEPVPIASSEIRALVAAGEPIDAFVPAEVAAEIARRGLYRTAPAR